MEKAEKMTKKRGLKDGGKIKDGWDGGWRVFG